MNEQYFTAALVVLEVVFSLMVLMALRNAGARISVLVILSSVFALWLGTVYYQLSHGFFGATGMPRTAFTLALFAPVIVGYLATRWWTPLGDAVDAMPTRSLLLLQHMRAAFGLMFFFTTAIPLWFKFLGGLGDIAAGIGAFVALSYFRKHPDNERRAIIRGNLAGILDFIVVLNVGVFVLLKNVSPDNMFDLIPLYVVPTFILLHIFSMRRLTK